MSKAAEARALPKREADVFKSIVKFYETKMYKKGIKAAESILKKFPSHGETLAMKGLIFNCLGKKEEGLELAKKGLRADLTSQVCWHVFGLLHKTDGNYSEAIKCYMNALKHDPESLQILKDLATLQVQTRDLSSHVETRLKLLKLKSNQKQNWLAYAVANHLAGNYDTAVKAIDSLLAFDTAERPSTYEDSEVLLYKNMILSESGKVTEALEHLESVQKKVLDVLGWKMKKGELLLMDGQHSAAEELYRGLLERGTENYIFHRGLQCAILAKPWSETQPLFNLKACALPSSSLQLTDSERSTLLKLYTELQTTFTHSAACTRIPLALLQGEEFNAALDSYLKSNLSKGVPSLGSDISALFTIVDPATGSRVMATDPVELVDHPVAVAVLSLCDTYIAALRQPESKLPGSDKIEEPSTLLWTLFLKSHLLEKQGHLAEALKVAEEGIEVDPVVVEMYQRKARVLKKMGALNRAADTIDAARKLDLKDRYMNNKTTKYMLRADRVSEAESTIALFTKHEGDPQYTLYDMQCSWYELEWADSHMRQNKLAPCLKKATNVEKHFVDFVEDQLDFHTYCMRKMTLRAYVAMIRLEDNIHGHAFYRTAAKLAVQSYVAIHDNPELATDRTEPAYMGMSAADKKKAKAKARKEAKRLEQEEAKEAAALAAKIKEQKAAAANGTIDANNDKDNNDEDDEEDGKDKKKGRPDRQAPVDLDPHGFLIASKDPLPEAVRFTNMLSNQAPLCADTWMLVFDVAIRRGKYLQALRAIIKGRHVAPQEPAFAYRTVQLLHKLDSLPQPLQAEVSQVITEESVALLGGQTLGNYTASLQTSDALLSTLHGRVQVARAVAVKQQQSDIAAAAKVILDGGLQGKGITVKSCAAALKVLEKELGAAAEAAQFKALCAERFPFAPAFGAIETSGKA